MECAISEPFLHAAARLLFPCSTSKAGFLLAVALAPALSACSSLSGPGLRGAAAPSGWRHVRSAFVEAAASPRTWVPLASAGVVFCAGADAPLSSWASDHTPVFGSQDNAVRWSDYLLGATSAAGIIGIAAAPGSAEPVVWTRERVVLSAASFMSAELTFASTNLLKQRSGRLRPDRTDAFSFPSGHTSHAAVNTALAARNLDRLGVPASGRNAVQAGLTAMTLATAWARVEARKHYMSDVLAGAALGNFLGIFMHALVTGAETEGFCVSVRVDARDRMLVVQREF